jgi:hypothetical protein
MFDMLYEAYMDMNEPFQTKFHHQNHKNQSQLTKFDFLGFLTDCALTDDFWTSNPWPKHFKWIPKSCEHVGPTLGPWLLENCACLLDWLISWPVWPNFLIGLHLRQLGQCNAMQWTMICYDLIWKCMYNDGCKFEVLQLPLFNQLGTRMDESNGCQTFRVNRDWIPRTVEFAQYRDLPMETSTGIWYLLLGIYWFLFSKGTATSRHRNDDEWGKKSQLDANGQLGKTRRLPRPTER